MEMLSELERAVLEKFVEGDDPVLLTLRKQLEGVSVRERRLTGVGFLTRLMLRPDAPRAILPTRQVRLVDVDADVDGLEHGAGFVLHIEDGKIDTLEGYTYADDRWPAIGSRFRLRYSTDGPRDLSRLRIQ